VWPWRERGIHAVAADLGVEPSPPAPPPISFAEASSRKAAFMADQKKVDAMMAGDLAATAEWRQITEGLSA